jgi:predicted aldo/keto reductase-like oxidoreductase
LEYRLLGKTGLQVSRLCYGTLTLGPLQANLSPETGEELIKFGLDNVINFIDTAEIYGTYSHIARAIRGIRDKIVLTSKSYAPSYEEMKQSVERALMEMHTDYIDIFLLHEQESHLTLKGHEGALEYLWDAKEQGKIRFVGASTHAVDVVRAAVHNDLIEVVHPMVNKAGLGIIDGTIDDMLDAVNQLHATGKGIYGMKALGGGNLINDLESALRFAIDLKALDAIAVGMKTKDEISMNLRIFSEEDVSAELRERTKSGKKRLHIDDWCVGCGECVKNCQQGALYLQDGKCKVHYDKCILCGYCSKYCRDFCIKVI